MQNINEILKLLNTVNTEKAIDVYIPSLKRDIKFKNINTGQQKRLIKTVIDNPIFQTRLVYAIYEIVSENCLDSNALSALTYLDSIAAVIQLRVVNHGSKYNALISGENYVMDLSTIVENSKTLVYLADENYIESVYTVNVGLPTIIEQYENEKQIRGKTLGTHTEEVNAVEAVGDAFIGEISKFIKEITVEVEGKATPLNYKALRYDQRYQVLEKLPISLVKSIMLYIEKATELQRQLLTFTGTNVKGQTKPAIVPLDSSLFNLNDF